MSGSCGHLFWLVWAPSSREEWSGQTDSPWQTCLPFSTGKCKLHGMGTLGSRCWPGACWVTRLVIYFFFKLGELSPCFLYWPSVSLGPRLIVLLSSVSPSRKAWGAGLPEGRSGGGGSDRCPGEVTSGAHPQPTPRTCPSPARPVGSPSSAVCR